MPLRRIHNQSHESVTAFYDSLANDGWKEVSDQMKHLIDCIETQGFTERIWVFTSLSDLCFTLIDDYSEPIIRLGVATSEYYRIEYSLPPVSLPNVEKPISFSKLTLEETLATLQSVLHMWLNDSITR